jgi:hypothetical protein
VWADALVEAGEDHGLLARRDHVLDPFSDGLMLGLVPSPVDALFWVDERL